MTAAYWQANYCAMSFVTLSLSASLVGYERVHYIGHIGVVVALVLLSLVPRPKSDTKKEKKQ